MSSDEIKKVFVIDDEPNVREIYSKVFSNNGLKVSLATDGEEGLLKAGEEIPDLILLDVMMPKMNGVDTLKALKTNELTKKIPILLLTNLGEEQIIK